MSSFFEALATARSVDPRIRPERHDAFVAARAMFLGTDNEAPQSRVQVQLIDPGIDPQHSLLLPQKINDGEDDVPRRKKTIIFPLLKAIGGGVVEQTTAVLQSDLSVGSKVARLAFKLPQLTNAIGYSLRLPAVLHEAGPVVSSSSLHSFAKMTRLINQSNRNRQTDDKKSIVNVTFHEKDQIFPAELMERQLNDARKVYSMQMPLPEERGLHQAKHVANYVRSVLDGMKQPDALTDAALRKFARSRKISRLALRAAVDFRLSEPMKLSSTDTFEGGDYTVSVIPEGSHTSVGLRNDAEQVVQRLYDPDSVVLAA